MALVIAIGAIFGIWTILRILGGERERQLQTIRDTIRAETIAALEEQAKYPRKPADQQPTQPRQAA